MPLDRTAARWLNGFCGVVAVSAIGGLSYLAWSQKQAAESVPISPETETLRKIKGKAYAAATRQDYPEAERQYLAAIAADPRDKNLHEKLARVYLAEAKPKAAWQQLSHLATDLPQATRLPADIRAWFADFEWQYGDRKKAEAICRAVTENDWIRPQPSGRQLVARTHVFLTENGGELSPVDSFKHLKRAATLNPSSVDAHVGLANMYWQTKEPSKSLKEVALARSLLQPSDGVGSAYLAFICAHVQKRAEAEKFALQPLKTGVARDDRLAVSLARVFADVGNRAKSLELVRQAQAKAKSPDAEALCRFASVYVHLDRRADAIRLLDQADKIAFGGAKAQVFEMRREILNAKTR